MNEMLSITQVAARLGFSRVTVWRKVKSGEIPASLVGKVWRVEPKDLQDYIDKGKNK